MPPSKREQAAKDHPNSWIPVKEGDTLEGVVYDIDTAWSDARNMNNADGWYPLILVNTDDGRVINWHAFETVAMGEVLKRQPMPGERITVTYLGEGKAKEGRNAPKLFKLVVLGRDPSEIARRVYGKLGAVAATAPSGPALPADATSPDDDLPF